MRKIIYIIILILCNYNTKAQNNNEDYILLDKILVKLVTKDKAYVYEKPSDFVNQEIFFSKTFLESYTHPTIGVDSKKVKKLIRKLDFNYLAHQKKEVVNWDLSKSKYAIVKYLENPANQFDKIKRYKISKPIYSKDSKMAFIYYEDICGFIDCGSTSVVVLKKRNGKWKIDLTIPISIS